MGKKTNTNLDADNQSGMAAHDAVASGDDDSQDDINSVAAADASSAAALGAPLASAGMSPCLCGCVGVGTSIG